MQFEGEHLLPGQLGHFFVILSLVSSAIASISYFASLRASEPEKAIWIKNARIWYSLMVGSSIAVLITIFYLCSHHYYEYMYAYKHASKELEYKYLLACIWEGQEGSFLLWIVWQGLLGGFFIFKGKEWEAPVVGIISLVQFFLLVMILGIYFFGIRIGNSPFTLTRNEIPAPIFSQPNYLQFLKDGMGLNVLLRNYWMVIHPPVLFLGFASTVIPFAFAFSGLLTRQFTAWVKPALPWILFSVAILGIGIMMGGKWAYESLSFGGYWAWDPVENASLVPWLLLVAGLHTMLIYNATEHSLKSSFLFCLLGFAFVLYSTFLTRTGILGDTSVHAFTEAGAAINFMIGSMVAIFALFPLAYYVIERKKIPVKLQEEAFYSREFWMFMGSLILLLSALFIITITSIPVFNKTPLLKDLIGKIHGGPLALPEDPEFLYNQVMIMVALMVAGWTATIQYLKYKDTEKKFFFKRIALPALVAALLSFLILHFYPLNYQKQGPGFLGAIYATFIASLFSVIANIMYIWIGFKGKLKMAGSAISHAGFALMLMGILISSSNKKVISDSRVNGINMSSGTDPMTKKADDPRENLTLLRDIPTRMDHYTVTYFKDSLGQEKGRKFYFLSFANNRSGSSENFILKPDVYVMKDNNLSSNPDIRSYPDHDIFTYISSARNDRNDEDTTTFRIVEMKEGDTAFYNNGIIVLNRILKNPNEGRFHFSDSDVALVADLSVISKDSSRKHAYPYIKVDSLGIYQSDDTLYSENIFLKFAGVVPETQKVKIGVREPNRILDFVTVKAYVFPYIVLVWIGLIIMAFGILLSMAHRARIKPLPAILLLALSLAGLIYMFLIANN